MSLKVSACITTYNHEPFIAQAIESVLMQKTDFDFEILIGEDDSSDNTREIVKTYAKNYPEKIRLFLNDRKNVVYINGRPTGRWNFVNNLRQAKGEYIALLDGDDYWTSKKKLQSQIDVMEKNKNISICFNKSEVVDKEGKFVRYFNDENSPKFYDIRDLTKKNFIATASCVFRNRVDIIPDWYFDIPAGDWALHFINASYGDIYYINDCFSSYRIHDGGVWSGLSKKNMIDGGVKTLTILDEKFDYKYHDAFKAGIVARKKIGKDEIGLYKKIKKLFINFKINL